MDTTSTEQSLMSRWLGSRRTWRRVLADVVGGIVLPVVVLILDRIWDPFHLLREVGAILSPLPRLSFLLTIDVLTMLALGFWLAVETRARQWAAFIGGVLLLGSLLAVGLGVASIVRLNFIGLYVCVPALLALFVYVGNAVRALREAGKGASWAQVAVLTLAGMLSVVALSLVLHKQPWELVQCLPDCRAADLSDSDLSHIYLSGCDGNPDLSDANLTNTDLRHAFLGLCNLRLQGIVMRGADLRHAVLDGVDLRGADLRDANLDGTSLYMVNLFSADLRGSQLSFESGGRVLMAEADLRGADLQGANLGLGTVYMDGAKYNASTKWPQGFDPAEFGAVLQE
jgi:uncharacterized protein YjbI with pentapeptide repeats